MRIVGPIEEIRGMISLTGKSSGEIACAAGIPATRLNNALGGFRPLPLDDMVAVRNVCREIVAEKCNATSTAAALDGGR